MGLSEPEWEVIKNLAVLVTCLAALVGIVTAILGIRQWRREHVGKRKIDLAEEVLALFYEARDVISAARSIMGYQGEGSTRQRGEKEPEEQSAALDAAYVVVERLRSRQELFSRIHALRYRFMAQNDTAAAKPFDDLSQIRNTIVVASRMLGRLWLRQARGTLTPEEYERLERSVQQHEAVFWEGNTDPDPISPEVDKVVEEIENTCRAIIRTGR